MKKLHVDIETYSSIDIKTSGLYAYAGSFDFEILLVAYALDDAPVQCYAWDELPAEFFKLLQDKNITKCAHNATFERVCFGAMGYVVPVDEWECTMIQAAYCGLPMSLGMVSAVLKLEGKAKLTTGNALIRYFCMPCKATKINGGRTRNMPEHNAQKWQEFKEYCAFDVEAERAVGKRLAKYPIPTMERIMYQVDQKINDRGVGIDMAVVENAIAFDEMNASEVTARAKEITGLDNPNSLTQLRQWVSRQEGRQITSLTKDAVTELLAATDNKSVREVLTLRQQTGKTSIKKYAAMRECIGDDGRARGLFQFYGAGRTGRWAGRLIQLQNLPRNSMPDLDQARQEVVGGDYEAFSMIYDVSDTLSQLVRTALIPSEGNVFIASDFSAIEARVIAWLAGEKWRLDVFQTHGKIYEASASKMFNVPIEQITKGSDLRSKGKVAELALGYQGGIGALKKMGGEAMGLSEPEMEGIVAKWRAANRQICELWSEYDRAAREAINSRRMVTVYVPGTKTAINFYMSKDALHVRLPSGRELIYWEAEIGQNRFGKVGIRYKGVDPINKQWAWVETYGGKLTENIVQATARDLLAYAIYKLDSAGHEIVMHIHDEVVCEVMNSGYDEDSAPSEELRDVEHIMSQGPEWAQGLPLAADGYICNYYKKD